MSDRLMSTGDVAEVLGVSEATVKRWADAGSLSCIRTPGGTASSGCGTLQCALLQGATGAPPTMFYLGDPRAKSTRPSAR